MVNFWLSGIIGLVATSLVHHSSALSQPKFYIYDWVEIFNDLWPPSGAVLSNRSGYSHDFNHNHGAGMLIDPSLGLFQTWQFSLYKNVMARLRVSEHRTR